MIILTRLGGHELALNPDLMERAEPTPDTVITMVDGHKIVVAESLAVVVARVRAWRASVAADAYALGHGQPPTTTDCEDLEALGAHDVVGRPTPTDLQARILRLPRRGE